jgi:hypothetical protein
MLDFAQQRQSLFHIAKTYGLRIPGNRPSVALCDFSINVPVAGDKEKTEYLGLLKAGAQVSGGGQIFETLEDIDFSKSATEQLEVIETSDSMRFKSGANADFLFKLVKVLTGETITISPNSEKSLLSITDEVERAYKITLAMSPMFIN